MRIRTFIIAAILAASAPSPVLAATKIADPEKFVRSQYDAMVKSDKYATPDDIYSPRLAGLFALDAKEAGGEVGRADFDFWTNAQEYTISDVHVTSVPVENSNARRVVLAKFKNIGKPEDIHFYFEKTKDGWKLDDARSLVGERWTLSLILKYGWDDAR